MNSEPTYTTPNVIPSHCDEDRPHERFVLRLFITGTTPSSSRAVVNVRRFCDKYLVDRHELEIIDISVDTSRAGENDIVAAPTLIKAEPAPARRFVGDMSHTDRLLQGMGLSAA